MCASCSVVNRTSATEGNAQICIPAIAWTNRDNLSYSITNEFEKNTDHLRAAQQSRCHCLDTCLRTCLQRDISCSGCLSGQGFGVMFFLRGERRHVLVQLTGLPVAHKLRAPSHAWPCRQNFDGTWCVTASVKSTERCGGCCARSPGEHHLDHPTSCLQQGGRCRRHCTCRRSQGNGYDV